MILLDTHTIIWWLVGSDKLSPRAKKVIIEAKSKKSVYISSISVWEIALLIKKGELDLGMDFLMWINKLEQISSIHFVPVDNSIASGSVFLDNLTHKDPADRIIISTAQILNCPIVTADRKIQNYKSVKTIW